MSAFLQKERRLLTRKRTKMSNKLTHRYLVVACVCCANNCDQKKIVLVPQIPVSTKFRLLAADQIQNVDCRIQSGHKMQTENLKSFFVWYVITCHLKLTERHAITFALFWNIPGPFPNENRS